MGTTYMWYTHIHAKQQQKKSNLQKHLYSWKYSCFKTLSRKVPLTMNTAEWGGAGERGKHQEWSSPAWQSRVVCTAAMPAPHALPPHFWHLVCVITRCVRVGDIRTVPVSTQILSFREHCYFPFSFFKSVFFCSSDWPGTQYIDQAGFALPVVTCPCLPSAQWALQVMVSTVAGQTLAWWTPSSLIMIQRAEGKEVGMGRERWEASSENSWFQLKWSINGGEFLLCC